MKGHLLPLGGLMVRQVKEIVIPVFILIIFAHALLNASGIVNIMINGDKNDWNCATIIR